jgi:multiple sugar transport system permease protein
MTKINYDYLLIMPAILWIAIFLIFPFFYVIINSFIYKNNVTLNNYITVFQTPRFYSSLYRTFLWTIGNVIFQLGLGLGLAILLNQNFKGVSAVRSLMLIPWLSSNVIVALQWKWIFHGTCGIATKLLMDLGITSSPISFFAPNVALLSCIIVNVWRWTPFTALVFLAGLQVIPQHLYESALIDGASVFQRFLKITLPLLKPIIAVWALITFIRTFNGFEIVWILTGGGPGEATLLLPIHMYTTTFLLGRFNEGSAISVLMTLMSTIFMILYVRMAQRSEQ